MTNAIYDLDAVTSQLSAHIWGHRFTSGQRGPEYVLEFLNVLLGTNYKFESDTYTRRRSIGLRKFIFEGVKEGARSKNKEILVLTDEEKSRLYQAVQGDDYHVLRTFLRNLEVGLYDTRGKEADRSWYARSLYPLHESLLYFEMRKKGEHYAFERNFYARGGELYFLMLMHGTEQNLERREFIAQRFKQLLTRNRIIQKVVDKITEAFGETEQVEPAKLRASTEAEKDAVPILPESAIHDNMELFKSFGVELEQLLSIDMDIYEMFQLLTSLICFQLFRYMNERAYLGQDKQYYFFDCLDGTNRQLVQLSAFSFEQHENIIKNRIDHEFEMRLQQLLGSKDELARNLPLWKENPDEFMSKMGLSQLKSRKNIILKELLRCESVADVLGNLKKSIREVVSDQIHKNQLPVTRILSRDGGFATYRRGSSSNYRYTISDKFLQMLVFTLVKPQTKLEYHQFLSDLFSNYGIVIGDKQAKDSGLYDQSLLNIRYFQDNEKALRDKLRHNGLLIEFSDATAMVQNPYTSN
jgi:hypothetical protein